MYEPPIEFTFDRYEGLLRELLENGYEFSSFEGDPVSGEILLRHDVDLSPRKALRMGEIEAALGVSATYYFLVSSPLYNVVHRPNRDVIAELESLGHEVGVHFSTHQYWQTEEGASVPDDAALIARIADEQRALSSVASGQSDSISFHRPPDWVLGRRVDGAVSTYEPRFIEDIEYRADSNQRWREEHPFAGGIPETLQLLTHPGLWGDSDAGFEERVRDAIDHHLGGAERFTVDEYLPERPAVGEFSYPVRGGIR